MIAERIEQWGRELQQVAKKSGEQRLLTRQLTLRFGSLPEWAVQRLERANEAQLERWSERLITAPQLSLKDLLK